MSSKRLATHSLTSSVIQLREGRLRGIHGEPLKPITEPVTDSVVSYCVLPQNEMCRDTW
jgi:hypothetical protein